MLAGDAAMYCWEAFPSYVKQPFIFMQHSYTWYILVNPYNADIFVYKPWQPKFFFQFEIILNFLVSSFRFIWIPMLWFSGHYKYCNSFSAVIVLRCQNLMSLTLYPPNYSVGIFTHLNLCLADAIHNFKWVKIIQIWQNGGRLFSNRADWCHIMALTCLKGVP